ncbi:MAG: 30S ribosomal protein S12 methylthiotransferase RimO [Planctomycetaceae bacterium]|nr:30S ribosomal protein S12 methylthiotransferase RimO [Planctomycetaceae bacterium]
MTTSPEVGADLNHATHSSQSKGSYSLITLGCPKNLVDSERMLGLLNLDGYDFTPQPEGADFVIVNTCGFLAAAREESLAAIREMEQLKREGRLRGIIVAGCMVERQRESLLSKCPGIDQLVGVFGRDEITQAADWLIGGLNEQRTIFRPASSVPLSDTNRMRITPNHLAYLKIAEGCDRLCTFCSIPLMRGKHASKSVDQVVTEARQLAADGARELNLVAQDLTYYGIDLDGRPQLAKLLGRLEQVDGVDWIRLMYLYPMYMTDELIDLVARSPKVLPYLDIPLQHINDAMLRRMSRRVNRAEIERLLEQLRERIEGLVLRTTMIVGFPGETEEQFEELVDFVRRQRFERLGVFAYSREPDTPSDRLNGHLPEEVREARRGRLLEVQQEIAFAWNQSQIGRQRDVLIDSDIPGEKHAHVGRSCAEAPEIDGVIYVTGENLRPGDLVPCEIVAAEGYDLVAVAVGEPKPRTCSPAPSSKDSLLNVLPP